MQNAQVRVQRVQKVRPAFGRLVQRERFLGWTGLTAGGFVSLTGPLAPRVVVSPLRAMSIKSALRDLLSVSYSMISITSISHLRWLPPFWCLTAPPFPRKRGHYKAPLCCEPLMKGLLCRALLSHRSARGRWWRQPPKGDAFPTPAGRLYGFRRQRRHKKWR